MNHPHLFTEPEKNVWLLQLGLRREPVAQAHIAVSLLVGEALIIHSMRVPPEFRRRGVAGELMKRMLLEIKDKFHGTHRPWSELPVYIHAIPYGQSITKEQLMKLYTEFGFERVAGHPFEMVMQRNK